MARIAIAAAVAAAACAPLASHAAEYATVVSSTPVTQQVNVPQRSCWQEQAAVPARPSGAGAVIGAVAGGLLGNTIAGGSGRAAATGLGAIAGAAIGNGVEANAAANAPAATVPVERCRVDGRLETRTVGYDVVYEYNGQRYSTRMASDPGDRIRIDVRPSDAVASSDAPAYNPPPSYSSQPAPVYSTPAPVYSAPVYSAPTVVYAPAPVYYYPAPSVYVGPTIGFGFYGGWHRGGHWHR